MSKKQVTRAEVREAIKPLAEAFESWSKEERGAVTKLIKSAYRLFAVCDTLEIEEDARPTVLVVDTFRERFDEWEGYALDNSNVQPPNLVSSLVRAFRDIVTHDTLEYRWPALESPTHLRARGVSEEQMMRIYGYDSRDQLREAMHADEAKSWEQPPHPNRVRFFESVNADWSKRDVGQFGAPSDDSKPARKDGPESLEHLLTLPGMLLDTILRIKPSMTREQVIQEAEELGYKIDASGMPKMVRPPRDKRREAEEAERDQSLRMAEINTHATMSLPDRVKSIASENPELKPAEIAKLLLPSAPEVTATRVRDILYQDRKKKETANASS